MTSATREPLDSDLSIIVDEHLPLLSPPEISIPTYGIHSSRSDVEANGATSSTNDVVTTSSRRESISKSPVTVVLVLVVGRCFESCCISL
jgi:hypothetical protein